MNANSCRFDSGLRYQKSSIMKQRFKLYLRLLTYLRPYKKLLFYSFVTTILFSVSNVYTMPLVRDIAEQLSNKHLTYFTNQVLNALGLFFVMRLSYYAQVYVASNIANRVLLDLRMIFYKKMHELPQNFFSQSKSGDLITRMFNDTQRVQVLIQSSFEALIPQILTVLGISGYLFYLSPVLTGITLISAPILMQVVFYYSSKLKRVLGQTQRKLSDLTHLVTESTSNMKMVQSFNLEDRNLDRFHSLQFRNLKSLMKQVKFKCTQEPIVACMQFAIMLGIVWFGGYLVLQDKMTGPDLGAFFAGVLLLSDAGLRLSRAFTQLHESMASVDRFFDIVDLEDEIVDAKTPVILENPKGKLEFKHVDFSYSKEEPFFQDFNLLINAGETIALVGESGSGKSTLLNLIPRFYNSTKGCIEIDGVNTTKVSLNQLRSLISIVPQEPFLIRGTILENIRMGRPTATVDEIREVIDQASAHFIYEFPDQLLTKIGDRGVLLSGGQKQRLSIARALLKNAQIMLMDEPTSSLDSQTESDIQASFDLLMKSRTCLVIAHRLSTIMNSDRIIVLDNGKIDAIGTHQELIHQEGLYKNLYDLQYKSSL